MESVKGLKKFFNQKMVSLLFLLIVIIVAFSVLTKGGFLHPINIRTILNLMAVTGLLTLGAGCLIIYGCIDLSTGATGTFCGIMMPLLIQAGAPWPIAVIAGLMLGMLVGAINAVLVNAAGFQSFIATMAMASVVNGVTFVFCKGVAIPVKNAVITYVGTGRLFDIIPIPIPIMVACFIIYGLLLSKSKFGRSVYLLGGNAQAARLSGLRPVRTSYILFMNSGMLAALAGMLLAARMKSGTTSGISGAQFTGITAAMLGGISFGGGSGNFAGVFVGLLIVTAFNNGLSVLGVLAYWQTVASGALLLFALTLDYLNGRRIARRVAVST